MEKNFKLLLELVKKEKSHAWWIWIKESVDLMNSFWELAKKKWFDCYVKWHPANILNYKPTNKTYILKTLWDISKLSAEQFEMLIDDLRSWCKLNRDLNELNSVLWDCIRSSDEMAWLDTWLNEWKVQFETTNKLTKDELFN